MNEIEVSNVESGNAIPAQLSPEHYQAIISEMKFARSLAWQFYQKRKRCGFDFEDIEGAALLGLCDAARRFDPAKNINFRTYCYFRIRGAMFDMFRKGPIPRSYFRRFETQASVSGENSVAEESEEGEGAQTGYAFAANVSEFADLLGLFEDLRIKLEDLNENDELSVSTENETDPESLLLIKDAQQFIWKLVSRLDEREQELMKLRYYYGYSLEEISQTMGVSSKSWISRLHSRALDRLRRMMGRENVYSFQEI